MHQSTVLRCLRDHTLLQAQLSVLEKMKQLLQTTGKDGRSFNIIELMDSTYFEGIDQNASQIFETSHPYERGKVYSFEKVHFPNAIAISIELDPRCSCDPVHD